MFTGIVEEFECVIRLEIIEGSARPTVEMPIAIQSVNLDDSTSVDGCCLTVTAVHGSTFITDFMTETLTRTTLDFQTPGNPVSPERTLCTDDWLDEHIVQGHVDATAEVLDRYRSEHWDLLHIGPPQEIAHYVAIKGLVVLDGVSPAVVDVVDASDVTPVSGAGASLSAGLIPETLRHTTLGSRRPGERVNLGVDILAKYAERLLSARPGREGQRIC